MSNLDTLALASALDAVNIHNSDSLLAERAARSAAIELRRLHDVNNELVAALKWYQLMSKRMGKAAIHSNSKEMLELMKEVSVDYGKRASSALAAAEIGKRMDAGL